MRIYECVIIIIIIININNNKIELKYWIVI